MSEDVPRTAALREVARMVGRAIVAGALASVAIGFMAGIGYVITRWLESQGVEPRSDVGSIEVFLVSTLIGLIVVMALAVLCMFTVKIWEEAKDRAEARAIEREEDDG